MKKNLIIIILSAVILFSKDVKVAFPYSTPLHVFDDGSGILLSIVREALVYKGNTVEPVFVNMGRAVELFKDGYVDVNAITQASSGIEAFYSDDFVQYHNVMFVLKSKQIKIKKLEDLKNLHILAFQNAHLYLGEDFGRVAKLPDKKYVEIADQKQQVLMFFKGRTDVAVMDKYIFSFYQNVLIEEKKIDKNIEFEVIDIFRPTSYQMAFRDEKLRDDFNAGMKYLKETGRYDEIYNEYSKKHFEVKK